MAKNISSSDSRFIDEISSTAFHNQSSSTTSPNRTSGRPIAVRTYSGSATISIAMKPTAVATELQRERVNRSVELGFTPPSSSTAG